MNTLCLHCNEPLLLSEFDQFAERLPIDSQCHRECIFRMIVGSIGHQKKECSCFGGEGNGDPETLTPREAALAAFEYFRIHPEGMPCVASHL